MQCNGKGRMDSPGSHLPIIELDIGPADLPKGHAELHREALQLAEEIRLDRQNPRWTILAAGLRRLRYILLAAAIVAMVGTAQMVRLVNAYGEHLQAEELSRPKSPDQICQDRMRDILSAAVAYRHDHGHPPAKLEDLSSGYYSGDLRCPITGEPYKFEVDGTALTLSCPHEHPEQTS
jgi:hypothetical protein